MISKSLFLLLTTLSSVSNGSVLSSDELRAYEERHFIFLEHLLISHRKSKLIESMHHQEEDLAGCRQLHRGKGGMPAALRCITFLNREERIGVNQSGSRGLVKDINILCQKLAAEPASLNKLLKRGFLDGISKRWNPCINETWRQVYLTAYANFDADPVRILALVRRARGVLPPGFTWEKRLHGLLRSP